MSRIPVTNCTCDMVVWMVTLLWYAHFYCAKLLFALKHLYEYGPWARFHEAIKTIVRQIVSITIVICIVKSHFTKQLRLICS